MANKARKTSKTQPVQSPVAVAVSRAFNTLLPALKAQAQQNATNKAAGESRSKVCVTAISELYNSIADSQARTSAALELFGADGRATKAEKDAHPGMLRTALQKDGVTDVQVWNTIHQCREVFAHFGVAAVVEASQKGLRKAYDARPGGAEEKKKAAEAEKKAAEAKPTVSEAGMIGDVIRAEGLPGALRLLREIESAMSVLKVPAKVSVLHDAVSRIAV